MEANETVALEPTEEAIDRGFELAGAMTEGFLSTADAICNLESEAADLGSVVYGVWINLTRELVLMGWTADDLVKDARYHAEDQAKEDGADKIGDTAGSA